LGFVGNLVHWHGLDRLWGVLAQLNEEGLELNCAVVGDGPMRMTWERQALELGLADRVRFLGRIPSDEIPEHIAGFDLGFVGYPPLPLDRSYHSPLKLYEYMAMARPAVAAASAESREIITPGRSGYLFNPGEQGDLKRILRLAMQEQQGWREIGMAAQDAISRRATWQARLTVAIPRIEGILEARIANPYAGD